MVATYLMCDGFDYGTTQYDTGDENGTPDCSTAQVHTGTRSLYLQVNEWVRYAISGTPDNLSVGIWLLHYGFGHNAYNSNNTIQIRLHLTTGEYIEAKWNGTTHSFDAYVDGVLVDSGAVSIPMDDWFHFQFYAYIDNAGTIDTVMDGVADISFSGDTLPTGAAAAVDYLYIWCGSNSYYSDDLIIATDDLTGDIRVDLLMPDGDTAVNDWTPSTGAVNYGVIDEIPSNTSDYTYATTSADELETDVADWDGADKTPVLVSAFSRAQESAAAGEQLNVGVDSNGVDDVSIFTMTSAWRYYRHYMNQDPDGPAAWTDGAIDALLLRHEYV